jgi:hypothetical protein
MTTQLSSTTLNTNPSNVGVEDGYVFQARADRHSDLEYSTKSVNSVQKPNEDVLPSITIELRISSDVHQDPGFVQSVDKSIRENAPIWKKLSEY